MTRRRMINKALSSDDIGRKRAQWNWTEIALLA